MSQNYQDTDYEEMDDSPNAKNKAKGYSVDYDKKRKRAEQILEKARMRELLGYDVDYED